MYLIELEVRDILSDNIYIKEAHNSGFKEGEKLSKLETARKMLEEEIDVSLIEKITGLSKAEIEHLDDN